MVPSSNAPSARRKPDLEFFFNETRFIADIPNIFGFKMDVLKAKLGVRSRSEVLGHLLDNYEDTQGEIIPGLNDNLPEN